MIGKNIFVWDINSICKGNIPAIVDLLQAGNFESAILHDAFLSNWRTGARIALLNALQDAGINPVGGAAVYGDNPALDGLLAANICLDYGLTDWVWDIESTFEETEKSNSRAAKMLQTFKSIAPDVRQGWCSWALYHVPNKETSLYHPIDVLVAGMEICDYGLPMAYWTWGNAAADAEAYLVESWKQWREVTGKPIIPVGRAYIGQGYTPNASAVTAFDCKARTLGAAGVSWWSMQHALDSVHLPGIWDALASLPKFAEIQPPDPPVEEMKDIPFIAQIDGQRVRSTTDTSTTGNVIGGLAAGQELTGLESISVKGPNDVWGKFKSICGWAAIVNGGTVYLKPK